MEHLVIPKQCSNNLINAWALCKITNMIFQVFKKKVSWFLNFPYMGISIMRKIRIALLCVSNLLASNAFSSTEHLFSQGRAIEYELPSNDPQIFSNIFFWKIQATCTIISDNAGSPITAKMLRKTGAINDMPLATGDSIALVVQPGDKLYITADSGAKVEMVNLGEKKIIASCAATT